MRARTHVAPHVDDHARTRVQTAGELPSPPPATHAGNHHQPRLGWTGSDATCWSFPIAAANGEQSSAGGVDGELTPPAILGQELDAQPMHFLSL